MRVSVSIISESFVKWLRNQQNHWRASSGFPEARPAPQVAGMNRWSNSASANHRAKHPSHGSLLLATASKSTKTIPASSRDTV
jgi:hypothetical protein